ncbi:septum formation initiator family protein [Mollicutes bacterium LVI A0075]|nr:septum formation initiator family protein [Mollicutes bacterium LVI A0075]
MINSVLNPYIEVRTENADLKKQINTLTETNESLQKSLEQSENSTAMEEGYIRERFHMSKKDELIFVFPND